jgi:hypothetical protein
MPSLQAIPVLHVLSPGLKKKMFRHPLEQSRSLNVLGWSED